MKTPKIAFVFACLSCLVMSACFVSTKRYPVREQDDDTDAGSQGRTGEDDDSADDEGNVDDGSAAVCIQNRDCALGELCVNGFCATECTRNRDCRSGELCIDGRCTVESTTGDDDTADDDTEATLGDDTTLNPEPDVDAEPEPVSEPESIVIPTPTPTPNATPTVTPTPEPTVTPTPGPPPASNQRYTVDAAAGVVTDNVTGLTWQRVVAPSNYTWYQAQDYCAALSLGGYQDWRLPEHNELMTLVNTAYLPTIDPEAFPGTLPDTQYFFFWTSSQSADSNAIIRVVDFNSGSGTGTGLLWSVRISVRCVR